MVRAIHVLAIPTGREADADHDAGRTLALGEAGRLATSCHGTLEACEVHKLVLGVQLRGGAEAGIADRHAEAGLEGSHLARREIVDCLAAVG